MLWSITSYFNPAGYASRLRNYRVFRANLTTPLVAVELGTDGNFELHRDDADIVVQIVGGDVLWQKERLLNLALGRLPTDCDAVAWIDCDVVFETADWAERTYRALSEFRLVQPFHKRLDLSRNATADKANEAHCESVRISMGYKVAMGEAKADDFRRSDAPIFRNSTAGLAWAARRELLERHGLYDACILGSADRAILCAATGTFDYGIEAVEMRGRQIDHYLAWARPFHRDVDGRVGFVQGRALHLWHGNLENRKYAQRHVGLAEFGFDPYTDIQLAPNGCWRWSDGKENMHEYVRCYFESRKEDG